MTTFKLLVTTLAFAGAATLVPSAQAQTSGAATPSAQATAPQDHSAHRPDANAAPSATPADRMAGMQDKMMADMKAQDAKLEALAAKMKAATGGAKVAVIEELLTELVQQNTAMHSHMMHMHGEMMMQMHGQMMKPMDHAK